MKDLEKKVQLFNPHQGIGGALLPLPESIREVANELDGQKLSLNEVLKKLEQIAEKLNGKVEVIEKYQYISFTYEDKIKRRHMYRLISYN